MAFQTMWYHTELPDEMVDIALRDLEAAVPEMQRSKLYGGDIDLEKRSSKNAWIPCTHWIGGLCLSYVQRANRENFLYDITGFDGENMQFTQYGEGEHYGWHCDAGLSTCYAPSNTKDGAANDFANIGCEKVRKLSFVLQLSSHEDYSGGEFQILNDSNKSYFAPKRRGTIIIFDSRAQHRVKRVRSGVRRSLVGWVMGPRWK